VLPHRCHLTSQSVRQISVTAVKRPELDIELDILSLRPTPAACSNRTNSCIQSKWKHNASVTSSRLISIELAATIRRVELALFRVLHMVSFMSKRLKLPLWSLAMASLGFLGAAAQVSHAAEFPSTYLLPNGEWHQLVIPAELAAGEDTPEALFADELGCVYGTDWRVFEFNLDSNDYSLVDLSESLSPGVAYWIIQASGADVQLTLPDSATQAPGATNSGRVIRVPLADDAAPGADIGWAMIGKPSLQNTLVSDLRVVANGAPACGSNTPCDLEQSYSELLTDNKLFRFNPALDDFESVSGSDPLPDWQGFWIASILTSGDGLGRQVEIPVASP